MNKELIIVQTFDELGFVTGYVIKGEVVRREDCKRWDDVPADETQDHECHLFDGNEEKLRIATPSYWFCPMGERKSECIEKI